jgi:hypothetical protein
MSPSNRILAILPIFLFVTLLAMPGAARADNAWLPVSPDDLALKDNPANPGADAMVLYRKSEVSAEHMTVDGDSDEEYVRIKIFTQAGTKYGDVEIPFVSNEKDVKDLDGRTILPDGTIVKFEGKVLEKEIEKLSGLKFLAKTISLPSVKPGCIIEYRYRVQGMPLYLHDEEWVVSQELFTREAHFSFKPYPGYTGYVPMVRRFGLPAEAKLNCKPSGECTMDVNNVPGLVDEAYMPPPRTLQSRVEFYYRSTEDSPTESQQEFWDRIGKKRNGEMDQFIDKKKSLDQDLAKIAGSGDDPEAKLRKIYARVQQVRNLSFEDEKSDKEDKAENIKQNSNVDDVLSHNYGTGRDINFLFIGLARSAGFEASDVLLAPRNETIFNPQSEDATELVADVVWVRAGSKEYYLDPASRYFPFGLLPWEETDVSGIRLTKKGVDFVTTPPTNPDDATIARKADLTIGADGVVTGTIDVNFAGERGALLRQDERKKDESDRKKDLEDKIKEWLPINSTFDATTIENWDDNTKPVHVAGTVKMSGIGTGLGKRFLVPINMFQSDNSQAFASEKRLNDIYFAMPYSESDSVKLRAPEGYKVSSVPNAQKVNPGAVTYTISVVPTDTGSEMTRQLVVSGIAYPKASYPALRQFFNIVRTDDNAQMVLQASN